MAYKDTFNSKIISEFLSVYFSVCVCVCVCMSVHIQTHTCVAWGEKVKTCTCDVKYSPTELYTVALIWMLY